MRESCELWLVRTYCTKKIKTYGGKLGDQDMIGKEVSNESANRE